MWCPNNYQYNYYNTCCRITAIVILLVERGITNSILNSVTIVPVVSVRGSKFGP